MFSSLPHLREEYEIMISNPDHSRHEGTIQEECEKMLSQVTGRKGSF